MKEIVKTIKNILFTNSDIKKFCLEHNITDEMISKNASVLFQYKDITDKCLNCDLKSCATNNIKAHLNVEDNIISITYSSCEKIVTTLTGNLELLHYSGCDIDFEITQPRFELLKYFDKFDTDYFNKKRAKGIYLHGRYGTGKSILLYQFAKKLAASGAKVIFAYYPDLVRQFQTSFGTDRIEELVYKLKTADILMLDDLGREANSSYIRDEILGPILQYRCDNWLPIFITSNRSYALLLEHLSDANQVVDKIKANALMERIKYLTFEYELKDKDFRNN